MTNPAGGMSINSVVAHFEQDVDCLPLQQAYLDSPDTHIVYVGIELSHKERLVALSKLFHSQEGKGDGLGKGHQQLLEHFWKARHQSNVWGLSGVQDPRPAAEPQGTL